MATTIPGPKYAAWRDKTKAAVDAHIAKLPADEQAKARAAVDKFRAGETKLYAKATEYANMTPEQRKAKVAELRAKVKTKVGETGTKVEGAVGEVAGTMPKLSEAVKAARTPRTPEQIAAAKAKRVARRAEVKTAVGTTRKTMRAGLKAVKPYKIRRGWFS